MKLLITPCNDRFPVQAQESVRISSGRVSKLLKAVSVRASGQTIELQNDQPIRTQIDSVLENIDITAMLDPTMLNTGGMEVLAKIKCDLILEIEAMLAS